MSSLLDRLPRRDPEALPHALRVDAPVVVMCASGVRSRGAAARPRAAGYRATSLSGGLAARRAGGGQVAR